MLDCDRISAIRNFYVLQSRTYQDRDYDILGEYPGPQWSPAVLLAIDVYSTICPLIPIGAASSRRIGRHNVR